MRAARALAAAGLVLASTGAAGAGFVFDGPQRHLQRADALCRARLDGRVCDADTENTVADILVELAGYSADPGRLRSAFAQYPNIARVIERDLATNFAFHRLMSGHAAASLSAPQAEQDLAGTVFHSRRGGAYGERERLEFAAGGQAKLLERAFDERGVSSWKERPARYGVALQGTDLRVELDLGAGETRSLQLLPGAAGEDLLVPAGGRLFDAYSTSPWECGA